MSTSGTSETTVFFGSGPVAAECLRLLLQHTMVEAVITKPRLPHHRGRTPVLELAKEHNLRIVTASTKKELDNAISIANFSSSYATLIDFGIIVSQQVIDYFPLGIINSHFSLLPLLRGADPITWAIANGDTKTGVSQIMIDKGMDTGKLLTQRTLHIDEQETAPTLTNRLIVLSDQLIQEYVQNYLAGGLKPKNQPHPDRATYSRKLTKQDGIIDWSKPAAQIEREIRAFQPWPASRTTIGSVEVIITKAHISSGSEEGLNKKCGDSKYLIIDRLKPIGKKEMSAQSFLAGYKNKI